MITDAFVQLMLGIAGIPFRMLAAIFNPQYPQFLREALQWVIGKLWLVDSIIPVQNMINIMLLVAGVEIFFLSWFLFSWFIKKMFNR